MQSLQKKYKASLHESIINLPRESFLIKFREEHGDKAIRYITKLREEIKKKYEKEFYSAKRISDFESEKILGKIQKVLYHLRNRGIFILDGEIEDYVKDKSILENGKITLNSIFKINHLLANGKEIKDIFEIDEFNKFIEKVLSD